jgi:2-succinyl-5-enolpyruvyl-6-hydroxy-3-cyclohexene-1-carboxylate synthase
MPIDFRNTNSVWASILAETLYRLGLTTAVICPGSRSAPLAIAFVQHPDIEAIPVLDERSASFFALGVARRTGQPTVLVCTSGTAGAHFYAAVIEARESRVPLLVLTADRPPELRDCNAGQTVDQQKLYGSFPNWYSELAVPSLELPMLAYLRQTLIQAWERTYFPVPGPVHLNLPFRDPLAPIAQPEAAAIAPTFPQDTFFASITGSTSVSGSSLPLTVIPSSVPPSLAVPASPRGLLIAGIAQPRSPQTYCEAIAHLAQTLQIPVLAEGLSPVRNYAALNPTLVSTYDLILRDPSLAAQLASDWVIRVGDMPTSKMLRQWLRQTQPRQWIIDPSDRNLDPLHGPTTHLRGSIEQWVTQIIAEPAPPSTYLKQWCEIESQMRRSLDQTLEQTETLFEGKIAWLLSQHLPPGTPLFVANSTAVRDVEWFWQPGNLAIQPFFNRGANGIDGILSTALGISHRNQSSVLLTGDLALLHDTNGFLLRSKWVGHLTIVLINNNGGGIFEMLPIAQFDPPFEEFFATPQAIDFAQLCVTYGVEHEVIQSWSQLIQRLKHLPQQGLRVLEVRCDRRADVQRRRSLTPQFLLEQQKHRFGLK